MKRVNCWLISFCTVVVFCIMAFLLFALSLSGFAYSEVNSESLTTFLSEKYAVGDHANLPSVDGYTPVLIYPSGKSVVKDDQVFTESGKYTIRYYSNTSKDSFDKTFDVYNVLFSANDVKSGISAGKVSDCTQYTAQGKSGVILDIAQGESVIYNEVIDLKKYNSVNDTLLSLSYLPYTMGALDASMIKICLTDIYDTDNVLTYELRNEGTSLPTAMNRTYVKTYAPSQPHYGLETVSYSNKENCLTYEGQTYYMRRDSRYGTQCEISMMGYDSTGPVDLHLDPETVGVRNLVFGFEYAKLRPYVNDMLIIDLDEQFFFGDLLWSGFKTGECILSISASSKCRILINEINGNDFSKISFTDENDNIVTDINKIDRAKLLENGLLCIDDDKPILTVDEVDFNSVDHAVIGKPLILPVATAFDSYSGECDVKTTVYTSYKQTSQAQVAIENGYFVPTQQRTYYIVYTAQDKFGHVSESVYSIDAKPESNIVSVNYGNPEKAVVVGKEIEIAKPVVANANGNYAIRIVIEKNGEESLFASINADNIDSANYIFRPLSSGEYTVKYYVSDYIYKNLGTSYVINVGKDNATPIFLTDADSVCQRYIIKDAQYSVPSFYGYEFVDGQAVLTEASVKVFGTSGEIAVSNGKFSVSSGDYIYYQFILGNQSMDSSHIKVVDVNYAEKSGKQRNVNAEKYFDGYSDLSVGTASTSYHVAKNASNEYKLSFINALQVFDFNLEFEIPSDINYSGIEITLIDVADQSNTVKFFYDNIVYANNAISYSFSVNNGYSRQFSLSATTENPNAIRKFNLKYADDRVKVSPNGTDYYNVLNEDGTTFGGFEKSGAWLEIKLCGIKDSNNPQMVINRVNNQTIRTGKDTIAPEVDSTAVKGFVEINSEVVIKPQRAYDVLDPDVDFTLTVTSPSGNNVVSVDGVTLNKIAVSSKEYTIVVNEYGQYVVKFEATDTSGRSKSSTFGINVKDTQAPTVSIGNYTAKVKIGDTVTVADCTVSENVSAVGNCKVYIFVKKPNSSIFTLNVTNNVLNDNKTFKVDTEGKYVVYYYVYDEAGNVTFAKYTIQVGG